MRVRTLTGLLFLLMVVPAVRAEVPEGLLFEEHFDDEALAKREWYDFNKIRIVGDGVAGKGVH